jgi:5-methyltetrahydrofolate--homocysteine methyltransferase
VFQNFEIYIPEVLIARQLIHAGLGVLKPILAKSTTFPVTKIDLGTPKGDLNDTRKNLVGLMLEGEGFEVIKGGIDVSPEKSIQAGKEPRAKIIRMSALSRPRR